MLWSPPSYKPVQVMHRGCTHHVEQRIAKQARTIKDSDTALPFQSLFREPARLQISIDLEPGSELGRVCQPR